MRLPGLVKMLVALILMSWAFRTDAEELTLILAPGSPATSATNTQFFDPWVKRVNIAGDGVVNIDFRPGLSLANPNNVVDRVLNDVAQIGWAAHNIYGSKFKLTSVTFLPFAFDDCASAAVALWRLYKTGLLDSDYADTVPLIMSLQTPSRFHYVRAPQKFADVSGLKMVVIGKTSGDVVERLGGAPITIPLSDTYQALMRGMANGALIGWTAFGAYKLVEVTSYHIELPFGATSSMVFMERKKFNALAGRAREVLTANGGEAASRAFGDVSDREAEYQRNSTVAIKGQVVEFPSSEQRKLMERKLAPMVQDWIETTPNGALIMETWRRLQAEVAADKQTK